MIAWDHWHIEASSICALKCPRCPRAEVPDTLLNKYLDLSFFKNQIGADVVKNIRKVTFCGNDGDPVYCRDLVDICAWMKQINPDISIVIITNGSYKTAQWWQSLAQILDHQDEIHWSLDGWDQSSNQQYRANCDWSSIMEGVRAFFAANSTTYRIWAAIAFQFNQDHLDMMRQRAADLGFDTFQITKSTKFGSHHPEAYGKDDPLMPTRLDLVAQSNRFQRQLIDLSKRTRPGSQLKKIFLQRTQQLLKGQQGYSGICLIGNKGVFLNSRGEFYPCCWTANRYPHNSDWIEMAQERFNLNHRTFLEIIQDDFWKNEFLKFDSIECKNKCTPERLHDREHTSEW